MQLLLPETKVPSEFSQPHSPVLGSLIQPVPYPLEAPWPLIVEKSQHTVIYSSLFHDAREESNLPPEESPAVCVVVHLRCCWRSASVGFTSTVWSAVVGVVLVIGGEDSKGLGARDPRVVRALGSLNGR